MWTKTVFKFYNNIVTFTPVHGGLMKKLLLLERKFFLIKANMYPDYSKILALNLKSV